MARYEEQAPDRPASRPLSEVEAAGGLGVHFPIAYDEKGKV